MDTILSAFLVTFGLLFGSATFLSLFWCCVKKCFMPKRISQEKIIIATPYINYGTCDQGSAIRDTYENKYGKLTNDIFAHV